MNNAWENLNRTWKERLEKLEDAMQAAVQYQDTLQVRGWGMPTIEMHVLLPLRVPHPQYFSVLKPKTVLLSHFWPKFPTSVEKSVDIKYIQASTTPAVLLSLPTCHICTHSAAQ